MKMSNMKILEQHQQQQSVSQNQQNIPLINTPNIGNNMVPIISVTAHSPGAKYYSILEDTLNQLQNIRENVVQMKNSTVQVQLNSSRLFSSCPSLSNLSLNNTIGGGMWSTMEQYPINSNRRKSWTAIEDLTECTKSSHKSVSLSSLDSEEQESIHAAERNRSSRNSTGGISTHSLNEAELARDFERIAAKRNLAPVLISRISLKKSISTPSIAPLRIPGTKEENNITTTRLISDSDDDNLDDETLLCVRDKIEVYADHPEKRRKRGSLFFRKKKDKTKSKSQSTTCDVCGATINLSSYKEHSLECKQKVSKHQSSKSGSGKKNSSNSHSTHHDDGKDFYDGHSQTDHLNYSDETPLIRIEFLNEPPIGPQDLVTDPMLGIDLDEHDSWSPGVPKDIMKSLKEKQVKRQEHIYEFIMTEKHHCQTLLVMQKIFVESLQKHFNRLNIDRMFPKLAELTELHIGFLKKLRIRQKENVVVNSISDILLDFFSSTSANRLKNAYGEFCSNHRSALEKFKYCMTSDQTFTEWYKHCLTNPLLKKKGIPECILFVTQRLTKYPLLIDPLLKSSREDQIEQDTLQKAMALVKEILVDVNARVAEKEKQDRQLEIFKCIDVKSFAMYKNKQFRKSDIGIGTNRKLKFEGYATLMQGRSKMQNVQVVVLSDCLFFLQENSHNKYTFFTPENKAGVVSLQKLLIREKAGTESRGIYIISSNPALPEMYELKVQNPKDKNVWIQAIRTAVLECPPDDYETDDLTAEEKQRLIDAKQADMRELIEKLHQKDIEQAILLEEKILLQLSLLKERKNTTETTSIPNAEEFLANFGSYKDLITDDCDTIEIWKRVLNTIQKISQLASSLYTAATGLPVSRSTSSVGEKQSEAYSSPTLPKRAETFGGFDERRNKNNIPWRDAVLSTLPITPLPTHNHHNHHHNQNQNDSKKTTSITLSNSSELINISGCASDANLNCLSVNNCYTNNNNNNNSSSSSSTLRINTDNISLKDNNYAALQVSHHLHTLLCIISQQMTAIQNLQTQLVTFRGNKSLYKHNDQLEELRNLQDKLQEEKHVWLKQKEQKEKELEDLQKLLEAQQKQIKAEQEDVKQQREQLYRKMELLSNQGILLSPNSPLSITTATVTTATTAAIPTNTYVCNDENINIQSSDENHQCGSGNSMEGNFSDRRKDKWRTSSIPKTPPVNLLSATNAPKVNQASIKQQIPMKLSSLSSTKSDRIPNPNNTITSPIITSSGGITQMLPLKLADKKTNQNITPNHSRTGSSPAIIQQPTSQQLGNPATRTNTYPKLPERYRVRTSDVGQINQSSSSTLLVQQKNQTQNNIMNLTTTLSSQSTSSTSSSTLSSIICHSTRNSSIYSSLTTSSGNCSTIDVTSSSATVVSNKLQTLSSSSTCNHIMSSSSPSLISMSSIGSSSLAIVAADNSSGVTTAVTDNETKQQQQQQKQQSPEEEEIYF